MESKKRLYKRILISFLVCLSPILIGIFLIPSLPGELPIHFDFQGTPDDWMSKELFFYGFPWFFALFDAICLLLSFGTKKGNPQNPIIENLLLWLLPAIEAVCYVSILLFVYKPGFQVERFIPGTIGVLSLVLGNLLPKAHQNSTFGFRNAYTLASKEVWTKVNRAGGYGLCAIGLLLIGCALIGPVWISLFLIPLVMLVLTISLWIYSKNLYKTVSHS